MDAEAVRVVSSLPLFEPGYQEGVAVPVWYMVPVTFSQKQNETSALPSPPPPPQASNSEDGQNEVFVPERQNNIISINEEPVAAVEQMPLFPGGDKELLKYVAKNTRYPEPAKENKIMGKVSIRFCVTETGKVDKVSVLKGVDPLLDAEAVRVISGLPDFEPGRQAGKEVPVWYMVPVTFMIR